jgi:hypothetical protein
MQTTTMSQDPIQDLEVAVKKIISLIVVLVVGILGAKPVFNFISISIELPPWPFSWLPPKAPPVPTGNHDAGSISSRPEATNREPKLVDYSPAMKLFDATGVPLAWYIENENGAIELYDGPGYHPRTGAKLMPVTKEIAAELRRVARECLTFDNMILQNGEWQSQGISVDCDPKP